MLEGGCGLAPKEKSVVGVGVLGWEVDAVVGGEDIVAGKGC